MVAEATRIISVIGEPSHFALSAILAALDIARIAEGFADPRGDIFVIANETAWGVAYTLGKQSSADGSREREAQHRDLLALINEM